MKLLKLVSAVPSIQALANTKLPVKTSYRVGKIINALQPELEDYEKQRQKLIQQYGKLSEDGTQYLFEGENAVKFQEKINEILDEDLTLIFPKLSLEDLGNIEIEPAHLAALDGFIIEDTSAKKEDTTDDED